MRYVLQPNSSIKPSSIGLAQRAKPCILPHNLLDALIIWLESKKPLLTLGDIIIQAIKLIGKCFNNDFTSNFT